MSARRPKRRGARVGGQKTEGRCRSIYTKGYTFCLLRRCVRAAIGEHVEQGAGGRHRWRVL